MCACIVGTRKLCNQQCLFSCCLLLCYDGYDTEQYYKCTSINYTRCNIHRSIYLSVNLSICLSLCPSIYLSVYLSICLSVSLIYLIYISTYLPMALRPLCFFTFLIYTQSVGILGRGISPSQGRYLHTEQHKCRINAYRYPCLEWDWSKRSPCPSGWRRFML
jgi:hypothetical protein